jgi:hypothetical protein
VSLAYTYTTSLGAGVQVESFRYEAPEGGAESLSAVLIGDESALAGTSFSVTVTAVDSQGGTHTATFGPVTGSDEYALEKTPTGYRTTLNAADTALEEAGAETLPELIPWQKKRKGEEAAGTTPEPLDDSDVPCVQKEEKPRARANVNSIVQACFASAGLQFNQYANGFPFEFFEEGRREYETEGKTPLAVAQDIFGTLNTEFIGEDGRVKAFAAEQYLGTVIAPGDDRLESFSLTHETKQYPRSALIQGADLWTPLPAALLDIGTTEAPDQDALAFETTADAILPYRRETQDSDGRAVVVQGVIQKAGGRITGEIEVTVGSFLAKGERGGVEVTRLYANVALTFSRTTYEYDPDCADALLRTLKLTDTFTYTVDASTLALTTEALGSEAISFYHGAVLGTESTEVRNEYSPQGWLKYRTTTSNRFGTLEQPDQDAEVPGAITVRDRVTTVTSESWAPIGQGMWAFSRRTTNTEVAPVWSPDDLAWTKLEPKTSVIEATSEILDNAPGSVRCPDPCDIERGGFITEAQDATITTAGTGAPITVSLPWVELQGSLNAYGLEHLKALKPRKRKTLTSIIPWQARRRYRCAHGIIKSVSVTGEASKFSITATCLEPDS